jgi:tetratricopeptide (TPR) repeat protein
MLAGDGPLRPRGDGASAPGEPGGPGVIGVTARIAQGGRGQDRVPGASRVSSLAPSPMASIPTGKGPSFGPKNLLEQGLAAQRAGRLDEAIRLFEQVAQRAPKIAQPHQLLALALSEAGRHEDALRVARRALKLEERNPGVHYAHGRVQMAAGHPGRARQAFERAASLDPDSIPLRLLWAQAADAAADDAAQAVSTAERIYAEAARIAPRDPSIPAAHAEMLLRRGEAARAIPEFQRALALAPGSIPCLANLAAAYRAAGDGAAAIESYREVLARAPAAHALRVNLAQTLREAGQKDEAIAVLEETLRLDPDRAEARLLLLRLRRAVARDAHTEWLEEMAADPGRAGQHHVDAAFTWAKVLEDLGERDASFDALCRANAARLDTLPADTGEDALLDRITQGLDAARCAAFDGRGCEDPTPIFVVGMPRSGTTLVEQILASHPDVAGAGETTLLGAVLDAHLPRPGYPEGLSAADAATLAAIGADYVERLRRTHAGARRIVDKMPLNFVRIAAIRAVLPNARIIHCIRDARDTCWSIFRQNFEYPLRWTCSQAELGRFYRRYEALMAHWRAVLGPDAFLDVRYEDVVDDLEHEARRMLDFVGLDWDPSCLDFHRTDRLVLTASLEQVRRPIYRSSVGAWRRHEQGLTPLIEALGPDLA